MFTHLPELMMIASGAGHAVVNTVLKAGRDKMASRALIDGFSALILLPFAFLVPLPHGAWGWLALSWIVHLAYLVGLIRAFEHADMSAAYPVMRGSSPVFAALLAMLLLGETITLPTALGIALVSGGTLLIAQGGHLSRAALGWAMATGLMVALYTVIDARGVRAAPDAASFIVWIFLVDGFGIALLFAVWRGPKFLITARDQWRPGLIAGALSIATYGLALMAYRTGAIAILAPLRETSILFALLLAAFYLKERIDARRAAGAALITVGAAVLIGWG